MLLPRNYDDCQCSKQVLAGLSNQQETQEDDAIAWPALLVTLCLTRCLKLSIGLSAPAPGVLRSGKQGICSQTVSVMVQQFAHLLVKRL